MKFKVGDRVKVRKDLVNGKVYGKYIFINKMEKYKGKIVTIKAIFTNFYEIEEDRGAWYWTDEMFENKKQYTYEDLKKSPIGTKLTFENGKFLIKDEKDFYENSGSCRYEEELKNLKDNDGNYGKIIKIEEPEYKTVYEYKVEILDEAEKRYLREVIRPFRDKLEHIIKMRRYNDMEELIGIKIKNECYISFPYFKKNTMYKGMEVDKKYTLEELGL